MQPQALRPFEIRRLAHETAHLHHSTAHEIAANIRSWNMGLQSEEECDDSLLLLMYGVDGDTEEF